MGFLRSTPPDPKANFTVSLFKGVQKGGQAWNETSDFDSSEED